MKLAAIVLAVVIVAGTAATMTAMQFVEEHETITQLVWNEHEALLISGMRRDGWRGSYAGYALQLFRGAFGDVPEYESNREWVLITHVTANDVERQVAESSVFPLLRPANGTLFWGNNPVMKWDGRSFVSASGEAGTVATADRAENPNYDNVEGWSSRMNLLNQDDLRVEIPLTLGGVRLTVVAERSPDRTQKSVSARFDETRTELLVTISEGHRRVSTTDYQALMTAH